MNYQWPNYLSLLLAKRVCDSWSFCWIAKSRGSSWLWLWWWWWAMTAFVCMRGAGAATATVKWAGDAWITGAWFGNGCETAKAGWSLNFRKKNVYDLNMIKSGIEWLKLVCEWQPIFKQGFVIVIWLLLFIKAPLNIGQYVN